MKSKRLLAYMVMTVFLCAQSLQADDLYPPSWRTNPPGLYPTTFQLWEFSTAANPTLPDVYENPFGTPYATIEHTDEFIPWIDDDFGHQGVWYVEDWIDLYVPNNPDNLGPGSAKEIWMQLTYYAWGSGLPQIFTEPSLFEFEEIQTVALDDYYNHGTYRIILEPNPLDEHIFILPRDCTIFVDQVVIDTICVPDPPAIMMIILGAIVAISCTRHAKREEI